MSLDIATVADRVSVEDVITTNNIHSAVDKAMILKHLKVARVKIKLELGENFTIAGTSYPGLYDDAIIKKTYALALPFLNVFYQKEFPSSADEDQQFYMTPTQVQATIAELESRINENIDILREEITDSNPNSTVAGGLVLSAAGSNKYYKTEYIDKEVNNDDQVK